MNIFILHHNPNKCSKYHSDKHVVKMILELTQLLTCAQYFNNNHNPPYENCYKKTHINHPMSKWVREHNNNYLYTMLLALYLCKEFKYRRNKTHACHFHLIKLRNLKPIAGENIDWGDKIRFKIVDCEYDLTPIPMCMPDIYIKKCAVSSYRAYYRSKVDINTWNWGRNKPKWY
jgi:hypothetical protein